MTSLRPLGYFLWGVAWLLIAGMVVAVPLIVLNAVLHGNLVREGAEPTAGAIVLTWIIGVPLCAWLFVVFPFTMLAQAAMAFVASGMALQQKHRGKQLVEFTGSLRHKMMEARVDTPTLRVLTAISALGTSPGWVFAISAIVVTIGLGVVVSAPSTEGALAAAAIITVGAGGAVVGIRSRVNTRVAKPIADKYGLTENYYKGLRYREGKRARDLQKARDAGKAGDIATWGRAEAKHALRTHPMAAFNARKGVPGALDAAFAAVQLAMGIPLEQAEQFVLDAATYRGKRPVPVRATR